MINIKICKYAFYWNSFIIYLYPNTNIIFLTNNIAIQILITMLIFENDDNLVQFQYFMMSIYSLIMVTLDYNLNNKYRINHIFF